MNQIVFNFADLKTGVLRVASKSKRFFVANAPAPVVDRLRKLRRTTRKTDTELHTSLNYRDMLDRPNNFRPRRIAFESVTAAVILDEFSHRAFATEFNLVDVNPHDWQNKITSEVDLLLVESAWAGNNGAWQYQLTGSRAPSASLRRLIASCQERKIPAVFWNKEDPPHFEDFLETARLFDIVFTTDENMLPKYSEALGHDRVFVLPFAAQPVIHNPARNGVNYAEGDIAFAGTYFRHKFSERRAQMDLLLGAADTVAKRYSLGFTIFSRHSRKEKKYQFPEEFDSRVVGSLPYSQMLAAYRSFKVFLNVNSVVNSPSMCARRIFEITASGTAVVSTRSDAVPRFFHQDEIPVVDSPIEAERTLRALVNSPELRERMVHRAQRRIWEEHTYRQRAMEILKQASIAYNSPPKPKVSIICPTNRDPNLDHLLSQVSNQHYEDIELLVLGHGIEINEDITERAQSLGICSVKILSAPSHLTLGSCLNYLVREAEGEVIAKFDDDDYYSANYLRDQVAALNYSGADLVGKASIYFYLAGVDLIARRWPQKEHKWTNFVAGATFVGPKETFLSTPFQELGAGEDSAFLRDLEASGQTVYSADRFNYMAVRNVFASHTWEISEAEILSYSTVETAGLNLKHIEV